MGKQSREKLMRRLGLAAPSDTEASNSESKTSLETACLFIIRWGTYLAMFVPLIVLLQFFFPFVAPKTTIFRILAEIIFAAYLFLAVHNSKYRPRINSLTVSLTIFLAVFILASVVGINFQRSFWSTYERMTGIFTMLHLYAFFIVLVSCFKKREDWERFLAASVIAGVLLSFYVLVGSQSSTRGGGTIGNTSFMAAYLLFNLFFAVILLLTKKIPWKIFSGISLLVMLIAFFKSTAEMAIASFFAGLVLLFLGYLFFSGKKIARRVVLSLVLIAIFSAILIVIFQPPQIKQEIQASLSNMKPRFVVWNVGLKSFLERPILGWGPENFNAAFQLNFNSCMPLSECGNEVWFDRVHNIIFDTLVATGAIGLASYLFIFLAAVYGLFRIIPKIAEKKDVFLPLGLAVVLITYFLQNLLVFDMINTYLLFFLTLAFAGFLIGNKIEAPAAKIKRLGPIPASIIIILTAFILWEGNVKPLISNHNIVKFVGIGNAQEVSLLFKNSLDSWMNKYEAREQFAQKLIQSGRQMPTDLSPEDRQIFLDIYEFGEREMEKSIQENYLDFRHYLFLGELYIASYRFSGNTEKIARAEQVLEKAIELSPTNQQGYWQLAEAKLAQRKVNETLALLTKAAEVEPKVGLSHWYLAMGYKIAGNYEKALEEIEQAKKNKYNWLENTDQTRQVIEVLSILGMDPTVYLIKDTEDLIYVATRIIATEPNNYDAWMALAAARANHGEYDKAREAAEKVRELKPEMTQKVEEFLKSLP